MQAIEVRSIVITKDVVRQLPVDYRTTDVWLSGATMIFGWFYGGPHVLNKSNATLDNVFVLCEHQDGGFFIGHTRRNEGSIDGTRLVLDGESYPHMIFPSSTEEYYRWQEKRARQERNYWQ